jgi:hypothetical protein
MAGIGQSYARLVHDETGWWGAYPPQVAVTVGDYLEFGEDGSVTRLGSSFDWPGWREQFPDECVPASGKETHTYGATRHRGAAAGAGATAGTVGVDAAVTLAFSREAGFVLDYQGDLLHRYRAIDAPRAHVLALAKNGDWPPERALVTEVVEAESATVVMSKTSSSTVVLSAQATLPAAVGGLNLADPTLGLTGVTTEGSALISLCERSTPLYHCIRIRRDWLRRYHADLLAAPSTTQLDDAFTDDPFDGDV